MWIPVYLKTTLNAMAENPPKRLKMDDDQTRKVIEQHKFITKKSEEGLGAPPLPQPFELPKNYTKAVQDGLNL